MPKYRIAWLPGDGIGVDVLEAAKIILDKLKLDAQYIPGDIGWNFWCKEGDALPPRTVDLLKNAPGVEMCGHADSHWSCVQKAPGEKAACPRVYFTMPLVFEATGM